MSKPIVFLKIPRSPMQRGDEFVKAQKYVTEYLDEEYHVLCVPTGEEEFEMQVFNDPNLTEANFEQLKEIVENALYELKYPNNDNQQELQGQEAPLPAAGDDDGR
jgi:hypothetical protein